MRAVVLAGGLGSRLRPYTTIIPKPLLPIGDRPILELIVRQLLAAGVTRIDLCVGYLGELIRIYFSEAAALPEELELRWHWEREPQGTAGALAIVPDLDETFIAMNGDIVTTLDYRELVAFHREQQATLTIATRAQEVHIDLGVIESENGRVTEYREKPVLNYSISMGIYVYEPTALKYLDGGPCQFPELVRRLLAAGERVATYRSDALWYDIGTFGEHERAMADPRLAELTAGFET